MRPYAPAPVPAHARPGPSGDGPGAGVTVPTPMRISARTQYALGAMLALAAADGPMRAEQIAASQDIPRRFCDNILLQLRGAGLVHSRRGPDGGYWLARPATDIALADVIRVTEGVDPVGRPFPKAAAPLEGIWAELRDHEERLLSETTLAVILDRPG